MAVSFQFVFLIDVVTLGTVLVWKVLIVSLTRAIQARVRIKEGATRNAHTKSVRTVSPSRENTTVRMLGAMSREGSTILALSAPCSKAHAILNCAVSAGVARGTKEGGKKKETR